MADARVLSYVARGQRVLELGCGRGELSRSLRERGCDTVGIEADVGAAKEAEEHCAHVIVGDVESLDLDRELGDRRFDVILALDVLPHLRAPEATLARLSPLLAPGGCLIASVPNVAHGSVRLALLGGTFPYAEDGLLDRTARRFFTRASLEDTLRAGRFHARHLEGVDLDIEQSEVPFSLGAPTTAFVAALRDQPDARAYELLAIAYPDVPPAPPPVVPIADPTTTPPHGGGTEPGAMTGPAPAADVFEPAQLLYLNLLARVLARNGFPERQAPAQLPTGGMDEEVREAIAAWLAAANLAVVHRTPPNEWPVDAETMLTMPRLENLISCVGTVVRDGIPGDLVETGVWRGGACILMRAALQALGDRTRTVWVADSFQGLPRPDPQRYPADDGDLFWTVDVLAVSLGDVMSNFEKYGLLDDQVRFLPGWFDDTLPTAPIERVAVLRLDGDMYGSTMQALESLYPRLSVGGFAIIDDFGAVPGCRAAVGDYRAAHGITEPLSHTDYTEVVWRKER